MKIGIVISTNDPETAWNALRLANTAQTAGHALSVFLMNKGVEINQISDQRFNVPEQLTAYLKTGGKLLACGTCMKSRDKESTATCPISTMKDLLAMIEQSDRLLTFG